MTAIGNISKLVRPGLNQVKLEPAKVCTPITEKTVSSLNLSSLHKAGGRAGSGIASPLTESQERLYYDQQNLVSSDGLFVLAFARPKTLTFTDANNNEVVIEYADPAA